MPTIANLDETDESQWRDFAIEFLVRPDTTYLNHGSFGILLHRVRQQRNHFIDRLDEQPMDFFLRRYEPLLAQSRQSLAELVGTEAGNLALVEHTTYAMNVVANSIDLKPGDEVLLTDHAYGSTLRIWQTVCQRAGAHVVIAELPETIESEQQVVAAIVRRVTRKTRLAVVSHVTSATALIMPISKICQQLAARDVMVCVDGAHAALQVEQNVNALACDFYCGSCHKWLCGPLGTGYLYVHPSQQSSVRPPTISWGRLLPAAPESWSDEFIWRGTDNPSSLLALPTAIDYFEAIGAENFRRRSRYLAGLAETRLAELFKTEPIASREHGWYGSMAHVPLPKGDWSTLQNLIWQRDKIEVMINKFRRRWFVRVSCHLYNNARDIDTLVHVLQRHVGR